MNDVGPRRLTMAIASAVFLVALLYACAEKASGQQAVAIPVASQPVYAHGRLVCHATNAPNGHYLARHCLRFGPPVLTGDILRPFAGDPDRDIAHILQLGVTVTLGTVRLGDQLAWRSERTAGSARLVRTTTGYATDSEWCIDQPGQMMWILCRDGGTALLRGDSGTGLGNSRGELAALFVGGDLDNQTGTDACGAQQRIFAVPVP